MPTENDERFLDLNDHGVLRVPGELWLAFVVLTRQWLLVVVGACSLMVGAADAARVAREGLSWWAVGVQAPVMLLMVAGWNRNPDAPHWLAWVWRQGLWLVTASVGLGLVWLGWHLVESNEWLAWPTLFYLSAGLLDVAIGWTVWRSAYFQAVFREFPAAAKG
jgi:hypothetical protein